MSIYLKSFLFMAALMMLSSSLQAQKVIEGSIYNDETGEQLPAANIIIKGVYQGTVSNRNGFYSLSIPDSLLPATVEVSFIGYYSKERKITKNSDREQNFRLKSSVEQLDELTVTARRLDLTIMERVIRRKQQWRKKLHNYAAKAYSRQMLSTDSSIVGITESISKLYWLEGKGAKEILKWRDQTKNIDLENNFSGVNYLPNLYDDNIEIFGFNLVGVTNPRVPKYYNFEVADTLSINGKAVYKIKVSPRLKLQPLFKGT
ncbi:MAG TPA: carboxypeptidase-like regulatory domain-containing protein, partial [Balneolaceae bacterium]|nr:carboxypeptidase-like regulatory domain-containing protein [Balneolaceae bacterium]